MVSPGRARGSWFRREANAEVLRESEDLRRWVCNPPNARYGETGPKPTCMRPQWQVMMESPDQGDRPHPG